MGNSGKIVVRMLMPGHNNDHALGLHIISHDSVLLPFRSIWHNPNGKLSTRSGSLGTYMHNKGILWYFFVSRRTERTQLFAAKLCGTHLVLPREV